MLVEDNFQQHNVVKRTPQVGSKLCSL